MRLAPDRELHYALKSLRGPTLHVILLKPPFREGVYGYELVISVSIKKYKSVDKETLSIKKLFGLEE